LPRHGQGEIKAPSGDDRNLDSRGRSRFNGPDVRGGHLRRTVKQGAVDIERNQSNRHGPYCSVKTPLRWPLRNGAFPDWTG